MTERDFIAELERLERCAKDAGRGSYREQRNVLERIEFLELETQVEATGLHPLLKHVERLHRMKSELQHAEQRSYDQLRAELRTAVTNHQADKEGLRLVLGRQVHDVLGTSLEYYAQRKSSGVDYDELDEFLNVLFSVGQVNEELVAMRPGLVSFQKTPARLILRLIELCELSKHDVVYDLGSGLGQSLLLLGMLSPARCIGIEVDKTLNELAKHSSTALGISFIDFRCMDAREAEFQDASVVYLYTPFRDTILREVLVRILQHTSGRPLRIVSSGDIGPSIAQLGILQCIYREDQEHGGLHMFTTL